MAAHTWPSAATMIGSIGGLGGITAFLTYRLKRRTDADASNKALVDAANSLTATALTLLEPVKAVAAEAERKIHDRIVVSAVKVALAV